jgi:dihydrofolate synthase / folylpolyglutamate synthase
MHTSDNASPPTPHASGAQPAKTLAQWLDAITALHPTTIDMGLERLQVVAQRIPGQLRMACPVITVAGTNGKGSTCAMLEAVLMQSGYKTGVYTSPHLVHFEERCRLLGEHVTPDQLCEAFEVVEAARSGAGHNAESLTYFEFTTLAIVWLLQQAKLDVVILEVGLGGRLDAVNLIDTDCAIITSVDIDHAEYLGHTREAIGREKAGIMRAGKPVIISDPVPPASVVAHARELGADAWLVGQDFNVSGDKQQWGWAGRGRRYSGLAYPALRGANQLLNAAGVLAALEALRPQLPVTAQSIRAGLSLVELPGRFQIVPGEPTLVLDVAHNPHAAATLTANLDAMGYYPGTHAVFGCMADKDVAQLLSTVGPLVDHWYFTDLPLPRAISAEQLKALAMTTPQTQKATLSTFANAQLALDAAVAQAAPTDRIVVFGSFFTVGGVLANGVPRLEAKHLKA